MQNDKMTQINELGYELGRYAAEFVDGFIAGFEDQNTYKEAEQDETVTPAPSYEKTQLFDCAHCMCNTCKKIERCPYEPKDFTSDIKPYPCEGCKDGTVFMDTSKMECEEYEHSDTENMG
jgi:hypothetical protein